MKTKSDLLAMSKEQLLALFLRRGDALLACVNARDDLMQSVEDGHCDELTLLAYFDATYSIITSLGENEETIVSGHSLPVTLN